MSANTLLMSGAMLKERTAMHGNIDEKLIYPDIKYAQDIFIKPLLGTALFETMQSLIAGVTPNSILDTANADYKYLLDTYIIDALTWFTLSQLPMSTSYQFTNKGIVQKQGDNTQLPSMSDMVDIANKYRDRAEYYAKRMTKFLEDQSARLSKYREYLYPGATIDTIYPDRRAFTNPIYLDGLYGTNGSDGCCDDNGWARLPYNPNQ